MTSETDLIVETDAMLDKFMALLNAGYTVAVTSVVGRGYFVTYSKTGA